MATRKKRSSKAKKKSSGTPLVAPERKKEVLGLILMVLAALVSLAVLTYTPADNGLARTFSLDAALNPGSNQATNALGLVGAALSYHLVYNFLGYSALLLTGLLCVWGWVVFRHRTPVYLPMLSVLLLVGSFVIACLFGWFALTLEAPLDDFSGGVGYATAGWMMRVFGTVGSFILLLLLLAITALLVIDRDIQRSIDRFEEAFASVQAQTQTTAARWRERREERRAKREAMIAERRKEREQQRQQRADRANAKSAATARATTPQPTTARRTADTAAAPAAAPPSTAAPLPPPRVQPAPPPPRRPEPAPQPATTPARPAAASSSGDTAPTDDSERPALKVQERVEEERTDDITRTPTDVPDRAALEYEFPSLDLLDDVTGDEVKIDYNELEENKQVLLDALETYKIEITEINAIVGPTVTLYELTPAPGVKISQVTARENDLAMAMAARGIRMIAPIPGKSAIGVEIPNRHRELVRVRDMIGTAKFRDNKMELPVLLGKTIEGEVFMEDLTKMPHLLIAGATGSGKSVGLNALVAGLLYACHPANLKFVMIDPKKIELQLFSTILDHFIAMPDDAEDPIITDFTQALAVLKSCEREMEDRYDLLSAARVRGIKDYNKKVQKGDLDPEEGHRHLPYIVVLVDELADLMMTAGKDIEGPIARLAQMARAVGIHLVLATQRPSVDVITGLIKANFPARIAYQVATKIDSRTVIDRNGAQSLVGNGDMLYMIGSRLLRLQGPFVSTEEIDRITHAIAEQPGSGPYILPSIEESAPELTEGGAPDDVDEYFEEAARIIVRSQQGSVSLLQRKLSVGYTRAARIVDQLEDAGIVGPFVGSKARDVLVADEADLDDFLAQL